ncbi:hypothetical protein NQZ68_039977 [Dissostichus eleginoides]|nr:hypothetical protein NQZ68_039977 [Dissostichus eleginoides]
MVLVVVSQGEALTCHCSSIPAICPGSVVTCELGEVCGSIAVGVGPRPYHVRKCMKADECMRLRVTQEERILTAAAAAETYVSYFKSCMSADSCRQLSRSAVSSGSCCSRDLCNT